MRDDAVLFSVLDLSPIVRGSTAAEALHNTVDLAQHAERGGYFRYWLAEHHNMPGIASAATSVIIGRVACETSRIRVGAGGIMLPNHAPLVIAEQFGTLESIYPERIDLGIGRAPGTDQRTALALRRGASADTFVEDLQELLAHFRPARPDQAVRAIPGEGLQVPIYLLGSSGFSARLAAELGLPFAFASHFAPDHVRLALNLYRGFFKPSAYLDVPYTIIGVQVVAAHSDAAAGRLFTSVQQQFLSLLRGRPGQLAPPVDSMDALWSDDERARVDHTTALSAVGSPARVRRKLEAILEMTHANELIMVGQIHDHAARLASFEIAAGVMREINESRRPQPSDAA